MGWFWVGFGVGLGWFGVVQGRFGVGLGWFGVVQGRFGVVTGWFRFGVGKGWFRVVGAGSRSRRSWESGLR